MVHESSDLVSLAVKAEQASRHVIEESSKEAVIALMLFPTVQRTL